jgi:cytochrome oxidase Cu insertion factor (SCO1/SenC/PrrC family)
MVNALDQIGPAADHVQPLFVTIDPERDEGSILRSFAQAFDKRLVGLGGTVDKIREAATALGVAFEKVAQGADYVVDHSSTYTLIDPGRSRALALRMAEPHLIAAKLIEELTRPACRSATSTMSAPIARTSTHFANLAIRRAAPDSSRMCRPVLARSTA